MELLKGALWAGLLNLPSLLKGHNSAASVVVTDVSSLGLKKSDNGGSTTLLGKVSNSLTVRKRATKPQSLKLQIKLGLTIPLCI